MRTGCSNLLKGHSPRYSQSAYFATKSKTKRLKLPSKHNKCINISILLWQHVSVLLDHLQANIQRCEVQSVHNMYCRIPYYLQSEHKIV